MARYVVGVDFGGTHLRAALVDENGHIFERVKRQTKAHLGPEAVFDRIAQAIHDVAKSMKEGDSLVGVGV
ncbi:MAG: ROK family protein, partial [Ardenticatenaceae bacterium]